MGVKRTCKECGRPLFGRADQLYCSPECKSAFHNKKRNEASKSYIRKVNKILRNNRQILSELNPKGKSKTTKERLIKAGFEFGYITNIYTTKKGTTYYFCYEQGYLPLDNDWYALVLRDIEKK